MLQQLKEEWSRKAFLVAGKAARCRIEDTIVIAGAPRSGTTFLLEVLGKVRGYKALNEPLLRRSVQEKYGFYSRTYLERGKTAPRQRAFLADALAGQQEPYASWMFSSNSTGRRIFEHATRRKLVVKFCRLSRMLHWFAEQFPVRGIAFIVRHPCAVVDSMIRFGSWKRITPGMHKDIYSSLAIDHLPSPIQRVFAPVLDRISTHAEALAVFWCLDNFIPLMHHSDHPWVLVPYERLLARGPEELERTANALRVTVTKEMVGCLRKPSISVKGEFSQTAVAQLSKWKSSLSKRQIDEILGVVNAVGFSTIYTDAVEPNYDRLNLLQEPAWRWTS